MSFSSQSREWMMSLPLLDNLSQITYIIAELGQEYDSLASTISSWLVPVSLEELFSLLLICESQINHNNQPL
jgi:hypothetical protein